MYAVIMAGGGGTRLWPLSRARRPKPFLPLLDDGRCLLAALVERLSPLLAAQDIFVVTDARYADLVREVAPTLPPTNIMGEPFGRNTAAAVALMGELVQRPADEVMVVLAADQAVQDEAGFRAALVAAAERAGGGDLVTLGIRPTAPATGYGYVIAEGAPAEHAGHDTYRVARFEEKPSPERAIALTDSGVASWNAGIFVWQRAVLRQALERYAPDIVLPLRDWAADAGPCTEAGWPGQVLAERYRALRDISIDYALLEPASLDGRVAVVPMSVGWSDLGSWSALLEQHEAARDTVIATEGRARVIDLGSRDTLVHAAGDRLVAIAGLEGIIVVDTPDALLVISADRAQDVKRIVDQLKAESSDLL
jgi:mannose-1-phosphate guanylyltransferase